MEQKLTIGSPEWFLVVRKFQQELVNARDAMRQNLQKAEDEIGWFTDDRYKEQNKNLQRIFASDSALVDRALALQGQDLIDFWSKPPDTGLFRTRAAKVMAQLKAGSELIEAHLAQLQVPGISVSGVLKGVIEQAEKILPSPAQIVSNLPWIVAGVALIAFFPTIVAFAKKQAREIDAQP